MTEQEIAAFLEDSGFPPHVVQAGAPGLLARWREFVAEAEGGYPYRLNDYRHDLDLRGAIATLGLDAEIGEADARFADLLVHPEIRVWESAAENPWWDFGIPRNPGPQLARDLRSAGLFHNTDE